MMVVVNTVTEAKASLSQLIEKVIAGQEVIISRARKPVAILTAYHAPKNTRKPGALRGQIRISDDFDTLPADIATPLGSVPQ
jgi:prevent-host-death family protein